MNIFVDKGSMLAQLIKLAFVVVIWYHPKNKYKKPNSM